MEAEEEIIPENNHSTKEKKAKKPKNAKKKDDEEDNMEIVDQNSDSDHDPARVQRLEKAFEEKQKWKKELKKLEEKQEKEEENLTLFHRQENYHKITDSHQNLTNSQ